MWHGPALAELLEDVTAEEARAHPIAGGHSIAELVAHLSAWCRIASRRLDGFAGAATDAEDWPSADASSDARWRAMVSKLGESYADIAARTKALTEPAMMATLPGRTHSAADMLVGLIAHGAYHGGQIALLKKMLRQHSP